LIAKIRQESLLQDEVDGDTPASDTYSLVNRALHAIAAHLQRYNSELSSVRDTLNALRDYDKRCRDSSSDSTADTGADTSSTFGQLTTQLMQVHTFQHELSEKLQNILALV
jgi:oligoendopeptidase F